MVLNANTQLTPALWIASWMVGAKPWSGFTAPLISELLYREQLHRRLLLLLSFNIFQCLSRGEQMPLQAEGAVRFDPGEEKVKRGHDGHPQTAEELLWEGWSKLVWWLRHRSLYPIQVA